MTLDETLAEATERGFFLSYLYQRDPPRGQYSWEAQFRSPILAPRNDGYVYTTGFGCGHTAAEALDSALDAILNDPRYLDPPSQPTLFQDVDIKPAPAFDLAAFLSGSTNAPRVPTFKVRL